MSKKGQNPRRGFLNWNLKKFALKKVSRGDTIVEVLLAIGIASFSIGVTYATAQHSLSQSATAKEHNQALNIIENQITDLKLRYQKSSTTYFNQNFTAAAGINHFCLDDNTTDPNTNWGPYKNYQSGTLDENSPLQAAAAPNSTNPYSSSCTKQKLGDGITYYVDIQTTQLSGVNQPATLYQAIARWEPASGAHVNQASIYYRINGGTASAFGNFSGGPPPPTCISPPTITQAGLITLSSRPSNVVAKVNLSSPLSANCTYKLDVTTIDHKHAAIPPPTPQPNEQLFVELCSNSGGCDTSSGYANLSANPVYRSGLTPDIPDYTIQSCAINCEYAYLHETFTITNRVDYVLLKHCAIWPASLPPSNMATTCRQNLNQIDGYAINLTPQ